MTNLRLQPVKELLDAISSVTERLDLYDRKVVMEVVMTLLEAAGGHYKCLQVTNPVGFDNHSFLEIAQMMLDNAKTEKVVGRVSH